MLDMRLTLPRIPHIMYNICMVFHDNSSDRRILKDFISKGDGVPVQLVGLNFTCNMKRYSYRQSIPAFRYNDAVYFLHWCIKTYNPDKHLSFITDSKDVILNCIGIFIYILYLYLTICNKSIFSLN